jgi:hypothetical protein
MGLGILPRSKKKEIASSLNFIYSVTEIQMAHTKLVIPSKKKTFAVLFFLDVAENFIGSMGFLCPLYVSHE